MDQIPCARIAVVADSSAYPPKDLVAQNGIHVVPLILLRGDDSWRDGVDIDPPAFYELLRTPDHFPKSAAERHHLRGALRAAPPGDGRHRRHPAVGGAERDARLRPGSGRQPARHTHRDPRFAGLFDDDRVPHPGGGEGDGRIGTASKLLGSALGIKPVLQVKDGCVQPMTNVRTGRNSLAKLLELVDGRLVEGAAPHLAVFNVALPDETERLAEQPQARYHPTEMIQTECSPVMGAHGGPGMVGVVFYCD